MNFSRSRIAAAPLVCLLFVACHGLVIAADASTPPASAPVATVDGRPLSYSALLAKTKVETDQMAAQRDAEIREITLSTARDRAAYVDKQLNVLVDDKVLALEAAAKKATPAALLAALPDPPVTDAQMLAFYDAQKSQIDAPFERIKIQMRQYLQKQAVEQVRRAYYDALRKKYGVKLLLPPLREHVDAAGPARGAADAPITIVEFSDFQCPFCGRMEPELQKLLGAYPRQVRLVYRNFPLESLHPDALHAAQAGVCAGRQGKFWPMHDLMFAEQNALSIPALKEKAKRVGLDSKRFDHCLDTGEAMPVIKEDQAAARRLGLSGTPSTFVDGRFLNGAVSYEELTAMVNDELQRTRAVTARR